MEKLSMCRICLTKNVRMQYILNTDLQETYERLTAVSFEAKDGRPLHVCYICYARLQNSCKLRADCLQSEELLTKLIKNKQPMSIEDINTLQIEHQKIHSNIVFASMEDTSDDFNVNTIESIVKIEPLDMLEDVKVKEEPMEDVEDDGYLYGLDTEEKQDDPVENNKFIIGDILAVEYDTEDKKSQGTAVAVEPNLEEEESASVSTATIKVENEMESEDQSNVDNEQSTDELTTETDTTENTTAVVKHLHRCDVCLKYFCYKSSLTRHKRKHINEKPKLSVYEESLRNKANLKRQLEMDLDKERIIKCDVCEKSFRSKRDLNLHVRIHVEDKPHKCTECDKSFTYKSYLNTHMRTHTGEKPYKCCVCQRGFSNNQHLKYHLHYTH